MPSTKKTPQHARESLWDRYQSLVSVNSHLDRRLVSFQANKEKPFYSWFKYKEGFSSALVDYLLDHSQCEAGILLDPFAGAGTALFTSAERGWNAHGIELLPVAQFAIESRLAATKVDQEDLERMASELLRDNYAGPFSREHHFQHIPITEGAFPEENEKQLNGYLSLLFNKFPPSHSRTLLLFACMCVLESISFTRKDGQYLRWDHRAGRRRGKTEFDKGPILDFSTAIRLKVKEILSDLSGMKTNGQKFLFPITRQPLNVQIQSGSCLEQLPLLESDAVDLIITSPPYCNRYDYTRTYALELAFLGYSARDVVNLRQTMLSCTVENKSKVEQLRGSYEARSQLDIFHFIDNVFRRQEALQEALSILSEYRNRGSLNNSNIPTLVENYFYEMAFVIHEMSRVLRNNGVAYMVNDNVKYAGEEIPVDLILSDFAQSFGFQIERIWALPRGKGNSSQQMGNHGRTELRKCIYVWRQRG